jgi:hypothetical protein
MFQTHNLGFSWNIPRPDSYLSTVILSMETDIVDVSCYRRGCQCPDVVFSLSRWWLNILQMNSSSAIVAIPPASTFASGRAVTEWTRRNRVDAPQQSGRLDKRGSPRGRSNRGLA